MKAKKKPIIMTALSALFCLSLVFGFVSESSMVAFAVTQAADNEYVFDFGDKVHIVGWYGDWDDYPTPWEENSTDEWWNDAVSIFNGRRWKTEPYMRWQNGGDDLQHNFLAWYPEDFVTSNSDLTNVPINLTGDPEEDDILIAKWSDTRPEDDTLNLEFDHLLARFEVNLDFTDQYEGDITEISIETHLRNQAKVNLLTGDVTDATGNDIIMAKSDHIADGYDWSGACITVPHEFSSEELLVIKFTVDGEPKVLIYTHPTELRFESGHKTTLNLKVGLDVVELKQSATDDAYPGGWESEANLDGTIGTIGTPDEGKTAWENEDKVYQHLYSDKYGNQTATLTYNVEDDDWTSNGTLKYLEDETPTVTAVYAPGCEIKSDNTIGLRDGQQYGMAEYIEANTNIDNDDALAVKFSPVRDYCRLRIVATPNETLTVTTTDFTPAGPDGATVPESYTLTTDANGNAYLYGTFAAGGSITVKNDTTELVTHTFTAATEEGKSYALEARVASVQIGNETKYYSTIEEAFTAVAGETAHIRLLNDTDFSSQISVAGDVTFDLNGHTASFEGDGTAIAFSVQKDANVTIKDSSASQSGYITSGSATSVYATSADLKLVSGRVDCVNVNESNFEMTGGTVEKGINSNSATVTISGGTVHGSTDGVKSSVMVSGGTTTIKDTAVLDGEYLAVWKSGKLDLSAYSNCENKVIYIASAVENIYTGITLPDGYAFYRNGTALGDESSVSIDDTLTINNAPVGAYPEG